jgi:hypothetical protein
MEGATISGKRAAKAILATGGIFKWQLIDPLKFKM